jgi:prophage antirepressor-like protein
MEELKIFQNPEFGAIRTMSDERGEPLFCTKDVCEALGYSNGRDAVRKHVEGEDKTTVAICDTGSNYKTNAVFINESYIDHRKGYIHIAYDPDRYSMWPFISNQ